MPSAVAKLQPRSAKTVEQAFLKLCGANPTEAQKSFIVQAAADWGDDGLPGWSAEDLARCITSSDRHFDWWRASRKSTSRRPARSRHLCTASVRSNLFRRISRYDIAYRDGR